MPPSTRLACPEDRARLLSALADACAGAPLQLAHAVDVLLGHPSQHPCLLVEDGASLLGLSLIHI